MSHIWILANVASNQTLQPTSYRTLSLAKLMAIGFLERQYIGDGVLPKPVKQAKNSVLDWNREDDLQIASYSPNGFLELRRVVNGDF